ncbi:toprim domain-containing protein [uncultured Clostridium sp.]|uniref:toprim domain-containing protein n=1 Tax=uncultured Clostridium sp. TaxID=59620 RepID=UPI0026087B77|nr:toprim domain-containing protein [uncultured Clostridium sp.]
MFQRKLTEEIINQFDIGFDKKTNCVTFPVYNKEGKCLFVIKRNVSFKKFYIPSGIDKEIFGLNQIPKNCKEIVICESVFNALTSWVYGKPAIALFGTGSKEQIETIKNLPVRKIILAFDGDEAGQKADKKFRKALSECKLVKSYHLPQGKDINDLSLDEFKSLKEF